MKCAEPESQVDAFDDADEPDEVVVLELADAPRRKRLFETLVRYGHPAGWTDEAPTLPTPRRKTYAEEMKELYPQGSAGARPTRQTRYGR